MFKQVFKLGLLTALTGFVLTGCGPKDPYPNWNSGGNADRDAIAMENDYFGDSASKIVYVDQGWSGNGSEHFYFTTQGSELMNYDVFVNLEQKANKKPFIAPKHISKYRYLPQRASVLNPDALPVGMTRDKESVGFTCAACHTNQINYNGVGIRVDGAPALADMNNFLIDLAKSVDVTLSDTKKFERLFAKVKTNENLNTKEKLRTVLLKDSDFLNDYNKRNFSDTPYGYARVDAFGRIYNQILHFVKSSDTIMPDAPVSYPFLWDTPQHDYVQWIGLTSNANLGSLGRNTGEVVGVFGNVSVKPILKRYLNVTSSVNTNNLVEIEDWLRQLKSPQWPEKVLPKIDTKKALRGRELYTNMCQGCHLPIKRDYKYRKVLAQMYDVELIKTDEKVIINALKSANTGVLKGTKSPEPRITGKYFEDKSPIVLMLTQVVKGIILKNIPSAINTEINAIRFGFATKEDLPKYEWYQEATDTNPFGPLKAYKARPLNGIWATAPYLHNGSVPSLYDLLLPEEERPKKFVVGRLAFDATKVGFSSEIHKETKYNPFIFDTTLSGNGNGGHEYGTNLSHSDKMALVEYMKSL